MANETIGLAFKNPGGPLAAGGGVQFEVPYGKDKYGIIISHAEMDQLLDEKYAQMMGRSGMIGSACTIKLESPDLPLFAWAVSLSIQEGSQYADDMSMEVAIVTQSFVYEHRGILSARRDSMGVLWEVEGYETQPPLRDIEEATAERAAA